MVSNYWEKPADLVLTEHYWRDPRPDVQGMLSSDMIAYYNEIAARPGMIEPFAE